MKKVKVPTYYPVSGPPFPSNSTWIKVDGETFFIDHASIQLSLGTHATIHITLDIQSNPTYSKHFIGIFDLHKKFEMSSAKFLARGCHIKSIDIDFKNKMILNIHSDFLENENIDERREILINDILDKTLPENNNINKPNNNL